MGHVSFLIKRTLSYSAEKYMPILCLNEFCQSLTQKKELVDLATISDQEIKNDEVIYMIFAKEGGGWEDLQIEALLPFGDDNNEHVGSSGISS